MTSSSKNSPTSLTPRVADASANSWVMTLLPSSVLPFAQLARWDRPVGWQLLLWPCLWSLLLFVIAHPSQFFSGDAVASVIFYATLFFIGAVAMRGAGCTYNDVMDHSIDARVARTASRPLPANRVSRRAAWIFIAAQILVGWLVLLCFNLFSILLAIASLAFVAVYPFMKRITYWPQVVLGFCFSWGALMGWASLAGGLDWAAIWLYCATFFWVLGYDTIYAHQDLEDDILAGVYSTARRWNEKSIYFLLVCYSLFYFFSLLALVMVGLPLVGYFSLILIGWLLAKQLYCFDAKNPALCLVLFKKNSQLGFYMTCLLLLIAMVKITYG